MRALLPVIIGALVLSGCCDAGLAESQDIELEPRAALRAIDTGTQAYFLIDEAGRVMVIDRVKQGRHHYALEIVNEVQVSSTPLVDVAVGRHSIWVVGEAGAAFESLDDGETWTSHPLDAGLEPVGVLVSSSAVIVYGQDFVRTRIDVDGEWLEPTLLDDGGWGSVHAGLVDGYDTVVLSNGSSLLVARQESPDAPFEFGRVDAPTEVVALGHASNDLYLVGGREGIVMTAIVGETQDWSELQWTTFDLATDGDIVAIDGDWVLTDAGELLTLSSHAGIDVGRARAGLAIGSHGTVVFGAQGPLLVVQDHECDGFE